MTQVTKYVVWGSLCVSTFIGSTCQNEWSSSSCWWCILPSSQSSPVLDGLLHSDLRCGQSTTSSFCQASLPRCVVPRHSLSSRGRRTFAVAGPTA